MGMRLASAFVDITANDSQFKKDIGDTRKTIGQEIQALAGPIAGLAAIGAAGAGFLKLAADAETTATAMNVVIKNIDETTQLLKELDKFSVVTPFTPKEVREAGSALVAMKNASKDIPGILRTLGDAAAGSNIRLSEMTRIFNKIQIEGKLTQETFVQLGAAGPSVMFELQNSLGKTREEVKKMQSQGKISFDIFKEALEGTTVAGGTFFNAMKEQSKTFNGLISTMQGNMVAIAEAIGNKMMPVAKALLGLTIRMANAFSAFDKATNGAATATIVMTGAVVGLGLAFKVTTVLARVFIRSMLAAALANPFTAVLVVLIAIGAAVSVAIGWVAKLQVVQDAWALATTKLKDAWENVKSALSTIFSAIQTAAISAFKSIAGALGLETGNMKGTFAEILADVIDGIAEFVLDASEWFRVIAENWGLVWDLIKAVTELGISFITQIFQNLPEIAGFVGGMMVRKISSAIGTIAKFVIDTFQQVSVTVVTFFSGLLGSIKNAILGLDFTSLLTEMANQAATAIEKFQKGALAGIQDQPLGVVVDVAKETKNVTDIFKAIGRKKIELEGQRTQLVDEEEEVVSDVAADIADEIAKKPLDLKFGFQGFEAINKSLQDAVLKAESPEDKTVGAIEVGNATAKRQEALMKENNELQKKNAPEVATS